jgi:hypothetical protein
MRDQPATARAVRRAVRSVIEDTPELNSRPALRRHLAERMVDVSLTAAELLAEDYRLSQQIADRAGRRHQAALDGSRAPSSVNGTPLAAAQAAGDINRQTAVKSAAGVLKSTKDAIDFPGFVTSLITGVFQAMTTSTIQQLQAVADLLDAVNAGASEFGTQHVGPDRAIEWAANRFAALTVDKKAKEPRLIVGANGEMPDAAALKTALDATDDEVSGIEEDNLEETLLPLVRRKLARDRQQMLRTMVLMGLQRIVVDDGRIKASMELEVNARSTAEQTEASRFDTRVNTEASGSFGMGMWGASAKMSATVGYVKSDEQFSREDIALRAGLRSSVDVGFHTEPISLERMASKKTIEKMQSQAMVPDTEKALADKSLLTEDERKTTRPKFEDIPVPREAPDPGSDEQRKLREKKDFGPPKKTEKAEADTAAKAEKPSSAPQNETANPGGGGGDANVAP